MTTKMLRFVFWMHQILIVKKLKRAQTDSDNAVRYDKENKPGISNLMGIYRAITKDSYEAIEENVRRQRLWRV